VTGDTSTNAHKEAKLHERKIGKQLGCHSRGNIVSDSWHSGHNNVIASNPSCCIAWLVGSSQTRAEWVHSEWRECVNFVEQSLNGGELDSHGAYASHRIVISGDAARTEGSLKEEEWRRGKGSLCAIT